MQATSHSFKSNARTALANPTLQAALGMAKTGFPLKRLAAIERLPEFEALREEGKRIKNHTLEHLDFYLEEFERKVVERGGTVHWCRTPAEARETILAICRSVDAKTVTKGKSMIAEEIALNEFLESNQIAPIETDLGEYIIQLRREPPSHIIAPAIHLLKEQVADAFRAAHTALDPTRNLDEPRTLTDEARQILRPKFLAADVGITGANFLVAETGSSIIVTNEGNGDLTQILPKIHIALASLEKVVPTLEDAATILRLLARSATGQEFSMLGTEFQDMLRCLRCSACINHCPVYAAVGGHAYGWVYPGPMGSVLTPQLIGVEEAGNLPNASTFCGRCESVCPMKIPLPKMMRHWREREYEAKLSPATYRSGLAVWAFFAQRPELYHRVAEIGMRVLGAFGRGRGRFRALPLAGGWTGVRDMPAPQGRSFHSLWAEHKRKAAR